MPPLHEKLHFREIFNISDIICAFPCVIKSQTVQQDAVVELLTHTNATHLTAREFTPIPKKDYLTAPPPTQSPTASAPAFIGLPSGTPLFLWNGGIPVSAPSRPGGYTQQRHRPCRTLYKNEKWNAPCKGQAIITNLCHSFFHDLDMLDRTLSPYLLMKNIIV